MKRLIHWLAHKFGRNTGEVVTWWQGDKLMVGFRCGGCGEVGGAHESVTCRRHKPDERPEHIASPDCWCEPEVDYVDPDTGVKVFVHRSTQ